MKILNIMLSRELGGIEQSFLDYTNALRQRDFSVVCVISLGAKIAKFMDRYCRVYSLTNLNRYDILSMAYVHYIATKEKPDVIIAHGNRAIEFCSKLGIKLVGVSHNYNIKHIKKCDYIFALTEHMQDFLIRNGANNVMILPNMINLNQRQKNNYISNDVPVIGAMGRFVKKKGFDIFMMALSVLKQNGVKFKAIVGGSGEQKESLLILKSALGLDEEVEFVGWISDKQHFFDNIDIFCLPSLHEPFGIILLEAMASKKPIVSSRSEGPSEIIEDDVSGILCDLRSPEDMAISIEKIIKDKACRERLKHNSRLRVIEKYDMKVIAMKLQDYLEQIKYDI